MKIPLILMQKDMENWLCNGGRINETFTEKCGYSYAERQE